MPFKFNKKKCLGWVQIYKIKYTKYGRFFNIRHFLTMGGEVGTKKLLQLTIILPVVPKSSMGIIQN